MINNVANRAAAVLYAEHSMKNAFSPVVKVTIRKNDTKFFGPGVAELLELIDSEGSVKDACRAMGISYSKGRTILRRAEEMLGVTLFTIQHGGLGGGAAALTDSARSIVSSYKAFEKDVKNYAHDSFVRFFPEDPKLL